MGLFIRKYYNTSLCIWVTLVWLCLLPAGLESCQLLVLRVWASKLSVPTLTLIARTLYGSSHKCTPKAAVIFLLLFISIVPALQDSSWGTLHARHYLCGEEKKVIIALEAMQMPFSCSSPPECSWNSFSSLVLVCWLKWGSPDAFHCKRQEEHWSFKYTLVPVPLLLAPIGWLCISINLSRISWLMLI